MTAFIQNIKTRNKPLFYFGFICFVASAIFLLLTKITATQLYGVNAWYKPFKFAVSIGLYVWTMAWYSYYLPRFNINYFNWSVMVSLGFELFYIALQAGKGEESHYNLSSPTYIALYVLMALGATLVTLYTAYIGFLFFKNKFPNLPDYYVWAIRLGILIFVISSLEGFVMGSRLNHSVGAWNNNSDWFITGWSKTVGDLRVAHFIGMHALQIIPLLAYYLLKNTKATFAVSFIYVLLALTTLIQALNGKPILKSKTANRETTIQNSKKSNSKTLMF